MRTDGDRFGWGLALLCAVAVAACSGNSGAERAQQVPRPTERGTSDGEAAQTGDDPKTGLLFELATVDGDGPERRGVRSVSGEPLSEESTDELLSGLPAVERDGTDQKEFSFASTSKSPPRTGEVESTPFPPESEREVSAAPSSGGGEVGVVRRSPEGEVEVAPRLSVTFSQPMIAVGEVPDYEEVRPPVLIRPELEGTWRWVGVRTAVFRPDAGRFPMATSFRATIPKDLTTADGRALGEAKSWTFETPALEVEEFYPSEGPQSRNPLIFMAFNQRVDREELLDHVRIWGGGETYRPRLAARPRVEDHEELSDVLERTPEGHWLAFYVSKTLRPKTTYAVGLEQGAPSAEGPRTTSEGEYYQFQTHGSLQLDEAGCGSNRCAAGEPMYLQFNHGLDPGSIDAERIQIEPELQERNLVVRGNAIVIHGRTRGDMTYRVRVPRDLRDEFGQRLDSSVQTNIEVGPAEPHVADRGLYATLDPEGPRAFEVASVSFEKLAIEAYRVEPEDWPAYLRALDDETVEMPGSKEFERTIAVDDEDGGWGRTAVDLRDVFDGERGHAVVVARGVDPNAPVPDREWRDVRTARTWVQSTDVAVDAFVDDDEIVAWTTSLSEGEPVEDVRVSLSGGSASARTGTNGVARLELPETVEKPWKSTGSQVVASTGDDTSFVPEYRYRGAIASQWWSRPEPPRARWYTFDDREMYRPGERVHVKGWVRRVREGELSMPEEGRTVEYAVRGPRGNAYEEGTIEVDPHGGFDVQFAVPEDANLGGAAVEFEFDVDGETASRQHSFRIQEFRTPSFEVDVSTPAGPHRIGGTVRAEAQASYYGGGAVRGADVAWSATSRRVEYTPPGWEEFVFGEWTPWWEPSGGGEQRVRNIQGVTDASGGHAVAIDVREVRPPRAHRVELRSSVTDMNRQTVSGADSLLVHPASVYVGLKSDRRFVGRDETISVDVVAAAIDGSVEEGRAVRVTAEKLEWTQEDGEWVEMVDASQTCEVESETDPVECTFDPESGGVWRITGRVRDDAGRPNETRTRVWVAGGEEPTARRVQHEEVRLVPQSKTWEPGETAEVLVRAPFENGEGLATLQRDGVVETIQFSIDGASHRLEVPLEESYMPNVQLRVDVVGEAPRVDGDGTAVPEAPNRPAFASQTVGLGVSTASRELAVDVAPASAYVEPGTEAEVDVRVETSGGEPASGAQVAVAVVDEAVLAAADYESVDPLEAFYPRSEGGVRARLFRESVLLASLEAFDVGGRAPETHRQMQMQSASGAEEAADSERGGEIDLRRDFRPLAHFEPALETGDGGRASLQFEVPDNVTRYRILAVAASGAERFGTGSDHLTAQLPVRVEPSMPRLLRWGDRADLPVLVHNQTEQEREVRIAAQTANLSLQEPRGVRLTVPANDRVEYRFASETDRPGTARVQFGLASERRNDAAEVEIPVRAPGTRESFAAHGTLDEGVAVRAVQVPPDALPSFGGLDVTTSSTALQELADAFLYVVDAPYECTEMYASRVLAIDALRDVSEAFRTDEMPDDGELESTMREDLDALVHLQTDTGGFPVWKRSNESDPYVSVHAAHALAVGVDRGRDGLREPLRRAVEYLRDIDEHVPKGWSQEVRSSVEAYAHYVLRKAGAPQPGRVAELAGGTIGEELSVEAAAWLVSTLAAMPSGGAELQGLRRKLEDRVIEESGAAHVTVEYEQDEHLVMHSRTRADALALEALLRVSAPDDLLEKFVEGLLGDRTRGRWAGTQENVFALRALKAYFDEKESETPDFAADLWLGEGYLGRHEYRERTVRRKQVRIPMSVLRDRAGGGRMSLQLDHSGGAGRMYYRIALDSVPRSRQLESVERGFAVERRYESVDGKEEVRRKEDGSWRVEAGSRVRVEVEMVVPSERHHVALEDPVAAGFEPLNPAVATTEPVPGDGSTDVDLPWWRRGPWFEHQNLREERAEAFTTKLEAGVYSYSYVVRATTPGEFVVPPPTAREMYHPETRGRGATDRVTIVPSKDH